MYFTSIPNSLALATILRDPRTSTTGSASPWTTICGMFLMRSNSCRDSVSSKRCDGRPDVGVLRSDLPSADVHSSTLRDYTGEIGPPHEVVIERRDIGGLLCLSISR